MEIFNKVLIVSVNQLLDLDTEIQGKLYSIRLRALKGGALNVIINGFLPSPMLQFSCSMALV